MVQEEMQPRLRGSSLQETFLLGIRENLDGDQLAIMREVFFHSSHCMVGP